MNYIKYASVIILRDYLILFMYSNKIITLNYLLVKIIILYKKF